MAAQHLEQLADVAATIQSLTTRYGGDVVLSVVSR
jgi:hypothetical protein